MKRKKIDTPDPEKPHNETSSDEKYVLRLYVTGTTPNSVRAIANIKKICEENLKGRYELVVIDLYQQPELAKDEQIIAAPTLIRKLPLPLKRIIGDMSRSESVIVKLDLTKKKSRDDLNKTELTDGSK
jgi:circadian clock protein KaiB